MIAFESKLPTDLGDQGVAWRQGLPLDRAVKFRATFEAAEATKVSVREKEEAINPFYDPQPLSYDFTPSVALLHVVKAIDTDFRERSSTPPDTATAHSVEVRTGLGNVRCVTQFMLRRLLPRYTQGRELWKSLVHLDDDFERAIVDRDTYFMAFGGGTEWYSGNFYVPTPNQQLSEDSFKATLLHLTGLLLLRLQTLGAKPLSADDDHLLRGNLQGVHRLPSVALNPDIPRILLLDDVKQAA